MYQGGQQGMNPNYGYEGGPPPPMIQSPLDAEIQVRLDIKSAESQVLKIRSFSSHLVKTMLKILNLKETFSQVLYTSRGLIVGFYIQDAEFEQKITKKITMKFKILFPGGARRNPPGDRGSGPVRGVGECAQERQTPAADWWDIPEISETLELKYIYGK